MTALAGILGAAALFSLLAFSATRKGTRLEGGGGCGAGAAPLDECSLENGCDGCGEPHKHSAWWLDGGVKDGDRR